MEKSFKIEKKSHGIDVKVYPDFANALVLMPNDRYFKLNLNSARMSAAARAEYERTSFRDFAKSIFNEDLPFVHIFSSALELYEYKARHGVKVANNNGNYPESTVLAYIEKKSNEFGKSK